jgi:hypothetical protein
MPKFSRDTYREELPDFFAPLGTAGEHERERLVRSERYSNWRLPQPED